jgi:cytochrome b pre-mRNA-processing protein 3
LRHLSTTPRRFVQAGDFNLFPSQFKEAAQSPNSTTANADINKIQGGTLDTYAAYGATEILYKQCADQAPYSIPKVKDDEEVPVLENGTQLGVGEGWWYNGSWFSQFTEA